MVKECRICGKKLENNQKIYCSRNCSGKGTVSGRIKEEKVYTHTCLCCGKVRERALKPYEAKMFLKQKYCSINCTNKSKRVERPKEPKQRKMHKHTCEWCGKGFLATQKERKYCSSKCVGKKRGSDNARREKMSYVQRNIELGKQNAMC